MGRTKIEWATDVLNPVIGCSKQDPGRGCKNCYAARMAATRLAKNEHYAGLARCTGERRVHGGGHHGRWVKEYDWTGEVRFVPSELEKPLHWRKPRRIFVSSMGDLFHEDVPREWIDAVFAIAASCSQHTFMLLTKRAERLLDYMLELITRGDAAQRAYEQRLREHFAKYKQEFHEGYTLPGPPTPQVRAVYDSLLGVLGEESSPPEKTLRRRDLPVCHWREWPLSNVHIGISASTQGELDRRVPLLLDTPAAVRFVSLEPLLKEVSVNRAHWYDAVQDHYCVSNLVSASRLTAWLDKLHGIIVGCETGPGARPMNPDWVRSIRDQCSAAGVPFFLKKLSDGTRLLDGREHNGLPMIGRDDGDKDLAGEEVA